MSYRVNLDEEQQVVYIEPIFKSIIKFVDDDTLKKIYFETGIIAYIEYIPDHILNDVSFIKEAIEKKLITFQEIPEKFHNADIISKQEYLNLLENGLVSLSSNIYPQDQEIIIAFAKNNYPSLEIEEKFLNNLNFMAQLISLNNDYYKILNPSLQKDLINNEELVKSILIKNKSFFNHLKSDAYKNKDYINIMLENHEGYNVLCYSDILRKITDSNLVLKALKLNSNTKVINQRFSSVIKQNKAKDNAYEFLKSYLLQQKLNKKIEPNEIRVKASKI